MTNGLCLILLIEGDQVLSFEVLLNRGQNATFIEIKFSYAFDDILKYSFQMA